ncbi:MAG TPA: DUF2721 domain-containing protein [Paludibacteraceae bacterium]|jgi:hypothetical protein|nr:DUF2721 domain-containing protein [Paludibacteraceae bacterium]
MEELTLITPTFLFSAVSLILLAYTNRFLAYTSLVRNLKVKYMENKSSVTKAEIENLKKRLKLTRLMQLYGVASLLLCVATMFLIYIGLQTVSAVIFAVALLFLIISLALSVWEINISSKSIQIHLSDMEAK